MHALFSFLYIDFKITPVAFPCHMGPGKARQGLTVTQICNGSSLFLSTSLPFTFTLTRDHLPPLPSINATRDKPSQFLNVSHTNGCCSWKLHCAISLDFKECGSSIFFPPVSFPIFHFSPNPLCSARHSLQDLRNLRAGDASPVNTLPVHGLDDVCVGRNTTSSPGLTTPCSTRPASTSSYER